MILHREPDIGELSLCPYLPDRKKRIRYFLASELDESETSLLLAKGWRKLAYKNNFKPREHYNWLDDKWESAKTP